MYSKYVFLLQKHFSFDIPDPVTQMASKFHLIFLELLWIFFPAIVKFNTLCILYSWPNFLPMIKGLKNECWNILLRLCEGFIFNVPSDLLLYLNQRNKILYLSHKVTKFTPNINCSSVTYCVNNGLKILVLLSRMFNLLHDMHWI